MVAMMSVSLFGDRPAGEAEAQCRVALRAVAALGDRHRAAVQGALVEGAGLDGAHEAARSLVADAYRVLAEVGIVGGEAANAVAAAFGRTGE